MNRKDYLMTLYDALEGLPAQVRADTISEYKEYFRTEAENGRADEDIIASLGDPTELANVIKNRTGYSYNPPPQRPVRKHHSVFRRIVVWAVIALIFSSIASGVGSAINLFGKGGWSNMAFGFGTRYDVNEIKEINFGNARKIEIRTTSTDTNIVPSNSNEVKASLTGYVLTTNPKSVPSLEISQSGDVITIVEKRENMNIIGFYSSNTKLDIDIPKGFDGHVVYNGTSGNLSVTQFKLESLDAQLSSGDILLKNISLKNDLYASSTSGNVTIQEISSDNVVLKSTSGDKKLTAITATGDIEIKAHSGNTRIEDITCSKISEECTSGDITVNKITADLFQITSHSGNVVLKELDGAAKIDATSGNIEVNALSPKGEYHLNAHSGNVRLVLPSNTGFSLNASVSSGNINCEFDLKNERSEKRSLEGTAGSGEIPVDISTTSGNINVLNR
jgi:DUF4097 and DUF4098 domain-containing protein YvlB